MKREPLTAASSQLRVAPQDETSTFPLMNDVVQMGGESAPGGVDGVLYLFYLIEAVPLQSESVAPFVERHAYLERASGSPLSI